MLYDLGFINFEQRDLQRLDKPLSPGVSLSTVFAGQNVGIKEVADRIWLVSFMTYDLGFFDHETYRMEPVDNPFDAKVLPMSPV